MGRPYLVVRRAFTISPHAAQWSLMAIVAAVLLIATLVVMTSGRVPAVLALIVALMLAGVIGIATPAQLLGGLSNSGVVTIAAMLVIAKGVLSTGVVSRVTFRLL